MAIYGQVVVGPPGAGKTTYCNGMQQYLRALGREAVVINLDPANEADPDDADVGLPYDAILDACEDIINLSSVMEQLKLGPNGGLMYCLEYMEHHVDSIIQMLKERIDIYMKEHDLVAPPYLLFDFPGQVELYTHNSCVKNILGKIIKVLDCRLVAIMLIDSHSCADASKFISGALLSTTTMLRLELPAVNVLSKIDLIPSYGESIPMPMDFFTDAHDLDRLLPYLEGGLGGVQDTSVMDDEIEQRIADDEEYKLARYKRRSSRFYKRYHKMHKEICEVIDDYSLLSYLPLDINDAASVGRVLARIDKCNGYVFTGRINSAAKENAKATSHDMFNCALQTDIESKYEQLADIKEKIYTSNE